jgi:O-antigen/teichoic acid export membrane protein
MALSEVLGAGRLSWRSGPAARSIVGNGVRLMGVNWVETVLGAVYFAVMARFLGPTLYGSWAYGIAAYTLIAGLAGLGFDTLILLRLGRAKQDSGDFLGLILTLRIGLLVIGAAALAAYALVAELDPTTRLVLLLFIPAVLGRGMAVAARNCFTAYERMAGYAKFIALFRVAELACGSAYLAAGGGLVGVVVLHAAVWLGEAGFGLSRVYSRLTRCRLHLRWREAATMLAQAAVVGVSTVGFTWLVSAPIVLLGHAGVTLATLGQFAVASSLTMILVGSGHAFFVAVLPVLSRFASEPGAVLAYGRTAALGIGAAGAAVAGIAVLLGPPIVELVLGAGYTVAGAMLASFLLVGAVILAPTGYEQTLLVAGRRWPLALSYVAGGTCLAAGFFPAVAAWGLDGALAATAAGWLVRGAALIGMGEFDACRLRRHRLAAAAPAAPGGDQLA